MRFFIFCFALIPISDLSGQVTIQNNVLSSGGNNFSNSSLGIEFTFGEPFTLSFSNTEMVTQGFHQPSRNKLVVANPGPIGSAGTGTIENNFISLYPNPFSDFLNIENRYLETLLLHIYDVSGRLIKTFNIESLVSVLNLSELSSGSYRLAFYVKNEMVFEESLIKIIN
jgi:hypothetical protein